MAVGRLMVQNETTTKRMARSVYRLVASGGADGGAASNCSHSFSASSPSATITSARKATCCGSGLLSTCMWNNPALTAATSGPRAGGSRPRSRYTVLIALVYRFCLRVTVPCWASQPR